MPTTLTYSKTLLTASGGVITSAPIQCSSGHANLMVKGNLGGGILTLQLSDDKTNWGTIPNADGTIFQVTQDSYFANESTLTVPITQLGAGQFIQAVLADAVNPNLQVTVSQ